MANNTNITLHVKFVPIKEGESNIHQRPELSRYVRQAMDKGDDKDNLKISPPKDQKIGYRPGFKVLWSYTGDAKPA